jgi:hypothetical protein
VGGETVVALEAIATPVVGVGDSVAPIARANGDRRGAFLGGVDIFFVKVGVVFSVFKGRKRCLILVFGCYNKYGQ